MKAFETYHPIVIFIYFVSVIGFSIFYMHPIYLTISLVTSLLLNIIDKRIRKGTLLFYCLLFVGMAISNPFFSHNGESILFYVNYNPVTEEAIMYGVAIASMIVSVILWFSYYNSVMTSDKFLYLFGKLSPAIALIISLSLRLVPMFKRQIAVISNSQKTIGMDYSTGSIYQRIKSSIDIISILITWALENAIETADSMKARGYGLKNRSTFSLFIFTKRDGILLSVILLLSAITIIGTYLGNSTYYFYPTFSEIRLNGGAIILYGMYASLLLIPTVIEIREVIKWRSLKLIS